METLNSRANFAKVCNSVDEEKIIQRLRSESYKLDIFRGNIAKIKHSHIWRAVPLTYKVLTDIDAVETSFIAYAKTINFEEIQPLCKELKTDLFMDFLIANHKSINDDLFRFLGVITHEKMKVAAAINKIKTREIYFFNNSKSSFLSINSKVKFCCFDEDPENSEPSNVCDLDSSKVIYFYNSTPPVKLERENLGILKYIGWEGKKYTDILQYCESLQDINLSYLVKRNILNIEMRYK